MSKFISRIKTRYEDMENKETEKESRINLSLEVFNTSYSVGITQNPNYRRKNIRNKVFLCNGRKKIKN